MTRFNYKYLVVASYLSTFLVLSCREVLEPPPVDLLVDDLVLNVATDVEPVRLGLYNQFRGFCSPKVMAGDFTADYIQFNGTFTDYNELGNKRITAANGVASQLWGGIYGTVYVANFILERINNITGLSDEQKADVIAQARFLRGMANFTGVYTYGDIPLVTTTDIQANSEIPRTSTAIVLDSVLADFEFGIENLPEARDAASAAVNKQYATKNAASAALARLFLYQEDWGNAEDMASEVINSQRQRFDTAYAATFMTEFGSESIFEVAYANNSSDDPGTSSFGLNNIFVGRREVIPSNFLVSQLTSENSGARKASIAFNAGNQQGNDNGWTVQKYGTPDQGYNNISIFRLAEMYLIRAEARANLNRLTGNNGALGDINALRRRADAPTLTSLGNQANALRIIETERLYELPFEGHRWYDLKRTGRLSPVMSAFSSNWDEKFALWPIPQGEIQRNPSLRNAQNPGY